MTPEPRRIDWLFVAVWLALGGVALAFACGALWLAGRVWLALWPVLWPWVQANNDGLIVGLVITVGLAAFVAKAMEDKRR